MTKKTEMLDIHGKVKYIHAVTVGKYGDWNITLYPDPKSLETIRDLQAQGLKNVLKKDDDGYFIQFRRETSRQFKGKLTAFAPPRVAILNKETNKAEPFDGHKIGWGSDVTLRLECRWVTPPGQTKQLPACRFDSVRVDNLVAYDPDLNMADPVEAEALKSIAHAPEPEPW